MQISGLTFRCCSITAINHHLFSSVSATSSRSSCLSKMSASNSSWDENSPAGVISGGVSSNFTLALLLENCNWYFIKGQCHEIFNIRFFSGIVFPTAPDIQFAPFQKYSKTCEDIQNPRFMTDAVNTGVMLTTDDNLLLVSMRLVANWQTKSSPL